jgi:CheY-like chemotaxis protein
MSQLDAGAVKVNWIHIDLRRLLTDVYETSLPMAAERGLELRLDIDDTAGPLWVRTDVDLLKRVMRNLVGNALKFTDEGWVGISAQSCGPTADGYVALRVVDSGPGIPLDEQDRVFEEFYQLGNLERDRSRGLGLGLAIVRRIANLIDAQVALTSTPGQGCSFAIAVPATAPGPAGLAWPDEAPSHSAAGQALDVLIIDDEPLVRDSLCMLLNAIGWQVRTAAGLEDAQLILDAGFVPQGLVIDFRLRAGASGLDALTALRKRGYNCPAVLVTGDTEPSRIAEVRAAALPVLYKPVDGLQLAGLLRSLVSIDQQPYTPGPPT